MPSFHIVSEVNLQEVENAIVQARKEFSNRFDFRGSKSHIEWDKKELLIFADDDYKLNAIKDILHKKLVLRGVDIMALKFDTATPSSGQMLKLKGEFVQGIDKENAKKIVKQVKDSQLKVQTQIEDEKIKVSSKSIDELQSTIAFLKNKKQEIPLQFNNMRS